MTKFYSFMLATMLLLSAGCTGKQPVNEEALKAYITDPDHGVVQRKENRGIITEVYYRPVDLIIAQELKGTDYTAGYADSLRYCYDSLDYFVLKISKDGKEIESSFAADPGRFSRVISYLNGDIVNDLRLKMGGKSLLPEQSAYVRTFGASTASSVMVVFKSAILKQRDDVVLTWEDTEMRTGIHEFEFKLNDIKQIPTLKL